MDDETRKALRISEYNEWLSLNNDGYRFEATATIHGRDYAVSTQKQGEEDVVREALINMVKATMIRSVPTAKG